jgi:hypothetical protein
MKLSKIVAYLNHLDTLSVASAANIVVSELEKINHSVETSEIQIAGTVASLASSFNDVKLLLDQYEENLKQLRADVLDLIKQQEATYFAMSSELYQGMQHEPPEYILKRTMNINQDSLLFLRKRLQGSHCDWRYPGMVIRPAHSPWVEDLVSLDPLYLIDTHADLIAPVSSRFTPEYQRRIRQYVINEHDDTPVFWNLPQRQFGFIYSVGYFNFRPWEILKQYMSEVFELLRDGGSFLFSFNDCDNWRSVGLVENNFCCYTPGRLIREHALSIGYEIEREHNDNASISWLSLRRPGTMTSIRGGQALAMILRDPGPMPDPPPEPDPLPEPELLSEPVPLPDPVIETPPEVVDISIQDRYNSLDLGELIDLARMLSVDISNDKNKGMFNIKKVRRTVRQYLDDHDWPEKQLKRLFKRKPK